MSDIKPLVITYNCGRELVKPAIFSNHIVSVFPSISPELIVVALEEIAPLAYSFLGGSFLAAYLERIRWTVDLTARRWGDYTYDNVLTRNLGMTALLVFARSDVSKSIVQLEAGGVGVGYQEMGNKGAVAIRLGMKNPDGQVVSFTFVAAHLAPMEEAVDRRNEDWKQIVRGLSLSSVVGKTSKTDASPGSDRHLDDEQRPLLDGQESGVKLVNRLYSKTVSEASPHGSHLIVAGDLNYRTANVAPQPEARATFPRLATEEDSPQHPLKLLPSDQLTAELKSNRTLHGLTEADINFPPTYKFSSTAQKQMAALEEGDLKPGIRRDEGGDTGLDLPKAPSDFPWAGHRWPSWCDRILWLPEPKGQADKIKPLKYTSLNLMSTSDHQPVALYLSIPFTPVLLSDSSDIRHDPPFELDPGCKGRRIAARRKEIATGAAAFMVMTGEGQAMLAALLVGALGGWVLISRLLV